MFTSSESLKKNRKRGAETVFKKIMDENFLNLVKDTNLQIQEAWKNSNRINPKKSMPRHKITKFLIIKDKDKLLEEEKKNTMPIRKHQFT